MSNNTIYAPYLMSGDYVFSRPYDGPKKVAYPLPQEVIDKFNESLYKSKGKTNNWLALLIAQQPEATVDDIVRLGTLSEVKPRVGANPKAPHPVIEPVSPAILKAKCKDSRKRSKSLTFDVEASRPVQEHFLAKRIVDIYGEEVAKEFFLMNQYLGNITCGHYAHYSGKPVALPFMLSAKLMVLYPEAISKLAAHGFSYKEMCSLIFRGIVNHRMFSSANHAQKNNDYLRFVQGNMPKKLSRCFKYDMDSLAHMPDEAFKEYSELRAPVFNGRQRKHRLEDCMATLTAETYSHILATCFRPSEWEEVYSDAFSSITRLNKVRISPLFNEAMYDALEKLGLGMVMNGYKYKGTWSKNHQRVCKQVIKMWKQFEKLTKNASPTSIIATRQALVDVFNEWSTSKAVGVFMFIRDDKSVIDEAKDEVNKKQEAAASKPKLEVTVEGLGKLQAV